MSAGVGGHAAGLSVSTEVGVANINNTSRASMKSGAMQDATAV